MPRLNDFYKFRKGDYKKDNHQEDSLLRMNEVLYDIEKDLYKDYEINHPFIFIFGLPRSGTTMISQVLAHSLDVEYINNLVARFWLAPLHGINLSQSLLGNKKSSDFKSDYARTNNLSDIHEFGYFWRRLLKKETMEDIVNLSERESDIDWVYVRKVLSSIQHRFDKAMVFKNIFGSYHLKKMHELLGKVIYVYIERDELDVAVSIMKARQKYYDDPNRWWSYTPPEYDILKDLPYKQQIAGQIYYLRKFYDNQVKSLDSPVVVKVKYENVCKNPAGVLNDIQKLAGDAYNCDLKIINTPPEFEFRAYSDHDKEKSEFKRIIADFENSDSK